MARHHTVRLEANGDYWTARWVDGNGKRRRRNLGRRAELSDRQARKLCERLAASMIVNPALANTGRAPALGDWIDRFIDQKADARPSSIKAYRLTGKYLTAYFGTDCRLDRIGKASAFDWRAAIVRGQVRLPGSTVREQEALAESTVCNYCRHAKAIFGAAVRQDVISTNPFAGLPTQPKRVPTKDGYVSREHLWALLGACPNVGWQALISLQRLGGLRFGEAMALAWPTVDWEERTITLTASKTGQTRRVPMDPELYRVMLAAFGEAQPGESLVLPGRYLCRTSHSTLHRTFRRIVGKAGLTRWPDLFQTLRRNAAQDFRQMFRDPWVVTSIMGHTEEVEQKYYLGQVRDEDIARITGVGAAKQGTQEIIEVWEHLSDDVRQQILAKARHERSAE